MPEQYRKASPVSYVTPGDAPMLLFQGTKDPLVPHTQTYRMLDAMTKAGVPGRAELIAGAGHGWDGAERARTTQAAEAFIAGIAGAEARLRRSVDTARAASTIPSPCRGTRIARRSPQRARSSVG